MELLQVFFVLLELLVADDEEQGQRDGNGNGHRHGTVRGAQGQRQRSDQTDGHGKQTDRRGRRLVVVVVVDQRLCRSIEGDRSTGDGLGARDRLAKRHFVIDIGAEGGERKIVQTQCFAFVRQGMLNRLTAAARDDDLSLIVVLLIVGGIVFRRRRRFLSAFVKHLEERREKRFIHADFFPRFNLKIQKM